MSSKVYSERFFIAGGHEVYTRYDVPLGRRAIITSVVSAMDQQDTGYMWLFLMGAGIYYFRYPVNVTSQATEMRVPVYGGEHFEVYTSTVNIKVAVSGYEFEDAGAAAGAAGEVSRFRRDELEQLPA